MVSSGMTKNRNNKKIKQKNISRFFILFETLEVFFYLFFYNLQLFEPKPSEKILYFFYFALIVSFYSLFLCNFLIIFFIVEKLIPEPFLPADNSHSHTCRLRNSPELKKKLNKAKYLM